MHGSEVVLTTGHKKIVVGRTGVKVNGRMPRDGEQGRGEPEREIPWIRGIPYKAIA